jgi:hypothetical protein
MHDKFCKDIFSKEQENDEKTHPIGVARGFASASDSPRVGQNTTSALVDFFSHVYSCPLAKALTVPYEGPRFSDLRATEYAS